MKIIINIGIEIYIPFVFVELVDDISLVSGRNTYKGSIMQLLEDHNLVYVWSNKKYHEFSTNYWNKSHSVLTSLNTE